MAAPHAFALKAPRLLFEAARHLRPGEAAVIARAMDRLHADATWDVPTSLVTLVDLRWEEHEERNAPKPDALRCEECGAVVPCGAAPPDGMECAGGDHVLVYADGERIVVGPDGWRPLADGIDA